MSLLLTGATGAAILGTGQKAGPQDYPWLFGLQVKGKPDDRCGAALIGHRFLLTAAHCVDRLAIDNPVRDIRAIGEMQAFATTMQFGEEELVLDQSWGVRVHPQYKAGGTTHLFDAALVRLAKAPEAGRSAPVGQASFQTGPAIVSGWGDSAGGSRILRAHVVPVVDLARCLAKLSLSDRRKLGASSICSVNRSFATCARDSGSPLVAGPRSNPQVVGIVSFGPAGKCGERDGNGEFWTIFTRASAIAPWVKTETGRADTITNQPPGDLMPVASGRNQSGAEQ